MNLLSTISFPNMFSGIFLNIESVAFTLFGIDVYWYGIIITTAVVLGITYGIKFAGRAGLISDDILETAFWGVIGGIVGARTYFVIFSPHKYSLYEAVFDLRGGGLAIYGGLIGAVTVGFTVAKLKRMRFTPLADLIGIGFLIGHCIGRWGNFFNQEAFGSPTAGNLPWGMTGDVIMKDPAVIKQQAILGNADFALVHPCFLYESLWCLIGFIFLHLYMKKLKSFDGEVFLLYVIWYGSGRAVIEPLRLDSLTAGGLRISQVIAIASAVFALGLFIYFKTTLTAKKGYIMYSKTDQSREDIKNHKYKIKLDKEKEKAKSLLKETKKELTDPFAENIVEDDDHE